MFGKKPLTCGQLLAALETLQRDRVLARDCSAMRALEALYGALTDHHDAMADDESVRVTHGQLPVTTAEVDEALTEVRRAGVGATAVRSFKKARDLLAGAEQVRSAERAAVAVEYVTRQQLDDFLQVFAVVVDNLERARDRGSYADGNLSYRLNRIAAAPADYGLSRDEHKTLRLFMALLDTAGSADGAVQRKRAAESATSCRAFHF